MLDLFVLSMHEPVSLFMPLQVQKHIKKCFEGINKLELIPIGKANNKVACLPAPVVLVADFLLHQLRVCVCMSVCRPWRQLA